MKRIEFVAPVEAMRGNLSGAQDLRYALNNNKAYEAPEGTNYARNYQTRYIGAKRAKDGLKYFGVRQRNAYVKNAATSLQAGLIGVTSAIYSAFLKKNSGADRLLLNRIWIAAKSNGDISSTTTFKKYFDDAVMTMLRRKDASVRWSTRNPSGGAALTYTFESPYYQEASTPLVISQGIWNKFVDLFMLEDDNKITVKFFVDNKPFIAMSGSDFSDVVGSHYTDQPNFAAYYEDLTADAGGQIHYEGAQLYYEGVAVGDATAVTNNGKYTTTAPA